MDGIISVDPLSISLGVNDSTGSANLTKSQIIGNCAVFVTCEQNIGDFASNHCFKYQLISGPNRLLITRGITSGSTSLDIKAFVVEFDPAKVKVQQGTFVILSTNTQAIVNFGTAVSATNKAFILHGWVLDNDIDDRNTYLVRGRITSTSQATFDVGTAPPADISGNYYLIEALNSEFTVQHKDIQIADTEGDANDTITAVDLGKAFLTCSYKTDDSSDGVATSLASAHFNSTTQIIVDRFGTANVLDCAVQVISWSGSSGTVQPDSVTYSGANASFSEAIGTAIDTARSFIVCGGTFVSNNYNSGSSGSTVSGSRWALSFTGSPAEVLIDRGYTAGAGGIYYYVVEVVLVEAATLLGKGTAQGIAKDVAVTSQAKNLGIASAQAVSLPSSIQNVTRSLGVATAQVTTLPAVISNVTRTLGITSAEAVTKNSSIQDVTKVLGIASAQAITLDAPIQNQYKNLGIATAQAVVAEQINVVTTLGVASAQAVTLDSDTGVRTLGIAVGQVITKNSSTQNVTRSLGVASAQANVINSINASSVKVLGIASAQAVTLPAGISNVTRSLGVATSQVNALNIINTELTKVLGIASAQAVAKTSSIKNVTRVLGVASASAITLPAGISNVTRVLGIATAQAIGLNTNIQGATRNLGLATTQAVVKSSSIKDVTRVLGKATTQSVAKSSRIEAQSKSITIATASVVALPSINTAANINPPKLIKSIIGTVKFELTLKVPD